MKKLIIVAVAMVVLMVGFGIVGFGQQFKSVDEEIVKWKGLSQVKTLSQSEQGNYWARVYAKKEADIAYCVEQSFDGGFIVCGETASSEVSGIWTKRPIALKLNSVGDVDWEHICHDQRFYDATLSFFRYYAVVESSDGGFVFAGSTTGMSGGYGGHVAKFFPDGNVEWYFTIIKGESRIDYIAKTADQGYVLLGLADKWNKTLTKDFWVIKLSSSGEIEWDKAYGGDGSEAYWLWDRNGSIAQTADGGYLVVGECDSFTVPEKPDIIVLKLSPNGDVEWQKTYGGFRPEYIVNGGPHVQETLNGEIYVICETYSFPGTDADVWVLKLFPTGDIKWQRKYGVEKYFDTANSALVTDDGGCIVAGETASPITGREEGTYSFLLKLFANGDIDWQRSYNGMDNANSAKSIRKVREGGYIVAGTTGAIADVFVFKVDEKGQINVSDCGVVGPLNFTSSITNGEEKVVAVDAVDIEGIKTPRTTLVFEEPDFVTDIVCWNLHKPPVNITIEQKQNRGLFGGEALNYISWNQNPENSQFAISEYRIYRCKKTENPKISSFEFIGAVDANVLQFIDDNVLHNENFIYVIKSVDSEGRESGFSVPASTS